MGAGCPNSVSSERFSVMLCVKIGILAVVHFRLRERRNNFANGDEPGSEEFPAWHGLRRRLIGFRSSFTLLNTHTSIVYLLPTSLSTLCLGSASLFIALRFAWLFPLTTSSVRLRSRAMAVQN